MMFALLGIGAAIFAWLEWRRPDQRNRAARTVAACLATSALVLIGYFRFDPVEQTRKSDTEAVLFTQGATFRSRQRRLTVCDSHFPGVA
jgi:predicted RNA-binding Zn ribbon-like protein